jgi:hypothetical protein
MVNIAGVELPLILIVPAVIVFFILIGVILLLFLKRGSGGDSPLEQQRMALVIPVDENESMGVGKLLTGVTRTESKILIPDPDIVDNQGQPKTFAVDITGIQPVKFLDAVKNIIEMHLIFDRGEWIAQSFASLLKNVKKRWDPLEADPQDIGDFYVGWGFLRKAFNQLLQSTTGKILVFGAVGLLGYLLGMFTIVAHVGHL